MIFARCGQQVDSGRLVPLIVCWSNSSDSIAPSALNWKALFIGRQTKATGNFERHSFIVCSKNIYILESSPVFYLYIRSWAMTRDPSPSSFSILLFVLQDEILCVPGQHFLALCDNEEETESLNDLVFLLYFSRPEYQVLAEDTWL